MASSLTSDEFQLGADGDAPADAFGDRASARVESMGSLGCLALFVGTACEVVAHVDVLDHQYLVLHDHGAFGIRAQPALACVDPARLQRAAQGACESTGRSRYHVVERGGMVGILPWGGAVVLADLVVRAEHDRLGFRR